MLKTTLLSTILALSLTVGSVAHAEEPVMTGPDGTAITQAELDEMGANPTCRDDWGCQYRQRDHRQRDEH